MERPKRNSVFVAHHGTIGKDLVFRHFTSKVVAARHPESKKTSNCGHQKEEIIRLKDANAFAFEVMMNSGLIAIYETCLQRKEREFKKALKEYYKKNKK